MLKRLSSLSLLLILSGCSSLPELPDLPLIGSEEEPLPGEVGGSDEGAETEADKLMLDLKSKGDGYLSFTYNEGHLTAIQLKLENERISLSRGATVIKKVPVGRYSIEVSGYQKLINRLETSITFDGQTRSYAFNVPSPDSLELPPRVNATDLEHGLCLLIFGSSLVDQAVELVKLDYPVKVFKVDPNCKIDCVFTSARDFLSPRTFRLPEGRYSITTAGDSREIYMRADTVNNIEITSDGFEVRKSPWLQPKGGMLLRGIF